MVPFLTWLQEALLPSFPAAAPLTPLDLSDHVTVIRKRLLQTMAPAAAKVTPRGAYTIIIQAPQHTQQSPEKKRSTMPA